MRGSKLAAQVVYEQKRNKFWEEKSKRIKGGRKMKVRATGEFKRLGVNPKELNDIPEEGTEFEVSGERYEVLKGNNSYKAKFVEATEKVREPIEVETAKKEIKTEKAVKRTTKKSK